MVFYLKVIGGADDGTNHRVESGDVVIGRAPTARIQLRDESVAWEHVIVRDTGNKLVVINLAAAGTKIRGKRITEETRIASGEDIQISPKVKLVAESSAAAGPGGLTRATVLLLGIVLLLIVALGAVFLTGDNRIGGSPPMTAAHWRQASTRLTDRMDKWVKENRFPAEALMLFRDARRLEEIGNYKSSSAKWSQLQGVLCGLPVPTARGLGKQRFPEAAGPSPVQSLGVVMGWDQSAASAQIDPNSDETMADALVWFVRIRTRDTQNRLKEEAS